MLAILWLGRWTFTLFLLKKSDLIKNSTKTPTDEKMQQKHTNSALYCFQIENLY